MAQKYVRYNSQKKKLHRLIKNFPKLSRFYCLEYSLVCFVVILTNFISISFPFYYNLFFPNYRSWIDATCYNMTNFSISWTFKILLHLTHRPIIKLFSVPGRVWNLMIHLHFCLIILYLKWFILYIVRNLIPDQNNRSGSL